MLTNKEKHQRYEAQKRGEKVPFIQLGPPLGSKHKGGKPRKPTAKLADHHSWKGDDIKENTGRQRARKMYKADACSRCGAPKPECHHVDGNPRNNAPENIQMLCHFCHMDIDGRLKKVTASAPKRQPKAVEARKRKARARKIAKFIDGIIDEILRDAGMK